MLGAHCVKHLAPGTRPVSNRRVQIELNLDGEQISDHAEDGTGPSSHFAAGWTRSPRSTV